MEKKKTVFGFLIKLILFFTSLHHKIQFIGIKAQ